MSPLNIKSGRLALITLLLAGSSAACRMPAQAARQIEQGAPADVFFSANPAWTQYLVSREKMAGETYEIARNRLVVIGAHGGLELSSLENLKNMKRLALADPAHVPAGIYAKKGLVYLLTLIPCPYHPSCTCFSSSRRKMVLTRPRWLNPCG